MTPVAATLDVSFVSNFTGQHRVCWRIPPSVVYNCSTLVTCLGGGATCSVAIPITVDNESCTPITYEGYVQAACEDISSVNGRIPFTITFTPVPTCASYRVSCVGVGVLSTVINNAGTGYDPLNPPVILPFGGGGSGATVAVTVGNSITTSNPGSLYADGVYPGVPVINITGTGTGAIATVTVAGGLVTGYTFTNSGSGYLPFDTFTFNDSDLGSGGGSGFAAGFAAGYGTITVVAVTFPGSLYTSAPGLIFLAPILGVTAIVTAVLDVCPDQILGLSCDGSPAQTVTGMPLGQSAIECMQLPLPALQTGITMTPEACCYDCKQVSFQVSNNTPAGADIYYTDCVTHAITFNHVPMGGTLGPDCAVNNSCYFSPESAIVTITPGASC